MPRRRRAGRAAGGRRRAAGGFLALLCLAGPAPAAESEPDERAAARTLRAALEAREQGDLEGALERLAEVVERHPVVADHAALLRVAVLLARGDLEGAVSAARAGAESDTPLRARFRRLEGDALAAAGDEATARAAWQLALAERPPPEEEAELEMALGRSLERAGDVPGAAARYRQVWAAHAQRPPAAEAEAQLQALERSAETSFRSAEDWRERGDTLFRHHHTEAALAAYDAALARGLSGPERERALARRAHCLFRLRRYDEATAAFGALAPDDPEARLWRARARARAGAVEEGVAELERIAGEVPGPLALHARYLAALLLEDDEAARARAHFEVVADGRAQGLASAARWRLGWGAWRDGRHAEAAAHFAALVESERDPIERLRPRYWLARAREAEDAESAARDLAAIAGEFPLSYYGWRARGRLPGDPPAAAAPVSLPNGRAALRPAELARVRILLEAGLAEAGQGELERLAARARGLSDRLSLGRLSAEAGGYHRAQRLVVDAYGEALARGPASGQEELWSLAWPLAYGELVRTWVRPESAIEPALVFAVMREESGYRPDALSTAGARGLLQIMPETGERLARHARLAGFSTADLFDPQVNIRLGSAYLDELARLFDGRTSAAVASYNAGPEAIARWIAQRSAEQDDEWVESMPYSQTRDYVKRVLRSLQAYRALY